MPMNASVYDLKTHLSRYLVAAEAGEVVVITRHNRPIAQLQAVPTAVPRPRRELGWCQESVVMAADFNAPETEADWEAPLS